MNINVVLACICGLYAVAVGVGWMRIPSRVSIVSMAALLAFNYLDKAINHKERTEQSHRGME